MALSDESYGTLFVSEFFLVEVDPPLFFVFVVNLSFNCHFLERILIKVGEHDGALF